jgi:hypothetical protein
MKMIKPYEIFKISSPGLSTCLTIYVNHPSQIHSLLAEAYRVASADLTDLQINELMAPVRHLIRNKKWWASSQATGIFVNRGFAGFMKIPFEVKNLAVVANSFHVKPLLKWLQREKPFYLLHLNRDTATLFQGSLSEIRPVEKFNFSKSKTIDFSLDLVERSVFRLIQRTNQPLIVSGDLQMTGVYKNLCQYKMLVSQMINEADLEPKLKDLHHECTRILGPYIEKIEDSLVKKYWSAKARGAVSSNFSEVVELALSGEVKHLFINEDLNIWGQIDYKRKGSFTWGSRQMNSQDDDLLDDLAELVLFHRGSVTVLPSAKMPESQAASAILRTRFGTEEQMKGVERILRGADQATANVQPREVLR